MIPKKIEKKIKQHCDDENLFIFIKDLLEKEDQGKLKKKCCLDAITDYIKETRK